MMIFFAFVCPLAIAGAARPCPGAAAHFLQGQGQKRMMMSAYILGTTNWLNRDPPLRLRLPPPSPAYYLLSISSEYK